MPDFNDADSLIDLLAEETDTMSKSERTRLKIMASAAKVFDEKGFENASIQDIANDAGIAKGTVYYYVEKKEDILVALLKFGKTHLFAKLEKGLGKCSTASEKIEFIIRNHLKVFSIAGPIVPYFAQSLTASDSKTRETMAGFRKEYLALLESVIEDGVQSGEFRQVNSRKIAMTVLSLVVGQIIQTKIFVGKINAKEIGDNTLDMVLHSLRSHHED